MTTTRLARPHRAGYPRLVPDPRGWPWPVTLGASIAAVAGLLVVHVLVGRGSLSVGDTIAALAGAAPSRVARFVVIELRLPRALIAVTAGALMGLSGAILQSVLRNPLAEPGTLGITSGGVLASVVYLAVNPATYLTPSNRGVGQFGGLSLPVVTLCGGLATGALVYALSRGRRTDPLRLILNGVLIGSVLGAATSLVLLLRQESVGGIALWLIGSLNGRSWQQWGVLWPWAAVALPAGLAIAAAANVLHLGDDLGTGLGLRVERSRALLLATGVLPNAVAISITGAIGFVGLIGPNLARHLVGDDARRIFPLSAILGGALVLGADALAGTVSVSGLELPVGAVMALTGGPFFLYLITRRTR